MRGFLNFITSNPWLIIIVIGGLFNVAVRAHQKTKEQRAKRAAASELQRRKAEALRTGKIVDPVVYDAPQQQSSANDDRQARIEALRQQRMAQLRAMREKRAATLPPPPSAPKPPTAKPLATPSPRPTPRSTQGQSVRPSAKPSARQVQTPRAAQGMSQRPPSRPRVLPPSTGGGARPNEKPRRSASTRPGKQRATPAKPSITKPKARPAQKQPGAPLLQESARPSSRLLGLGTPVSVHSLLRDPSMLRQAIIAKEILDAPIALRQEQHMPGSMPR